MPPGPGRLAVASLALAIAVVAGSCVKRVERELVLPDQSRTLDGASPYLKAHLRSGYVYVLAGWHVDSLANAIEGQGELLDARRVRVDSGRFHLPLDSVALLETNVLRRSGAATALTVMAGVTAAVAVACVTSPKTCFGSCPTFYAPDSAGVERLQAEAFSASIAPALEATDVDMLYHVRPRGREFTIRVTNEALETHVIRFANLLVALRPENGECSRPPRGRSGPQVRSRLHRAARRRRATVARPWSPQTAVSVRAWPTRPTWRRGKRSSSSSIACRLDPSGS